MWESGFGPIDTAEITIAGKSIAEVARGFAGPSPECD
jgi:hypothetical protein